MTDTHAHIDGPEFLQDIDTVLQNAKNAGINRIFIPGINIDSIDNILNLCKKHPGFLYPMIGLHPEDVNPNIINLDNTLDRIHQILQQDSISDKHFIAVGEVGIDLYWDQTYKQQQLYAFEKQVQMAVEFDLPLMIHTRNAQPEVVSVIKKYEGRVRGVFHCFTGSNEEAAQLLQFQNFVLGIGGVATFKKSTLPQTLAETVPLNRIVLETDSPYMALVPMRGKRNEPAFVRYVANTIANIYNTDINTVKSITNNNVLQIFGI